MNKPFSVLLLINNDNNDDFETFYSFVQAKSAKDAVKKAFNKFSESQISIDNKEMTTLLVIEGHHRDVQGE